VNMEISLIILSITLFLSIIFTHRLYTINSELKSENDKLKSEVDKSKKDKEELVSIDPGDRAILPDYGLQHTDTKESFHVTYEVEIVEVSVDKVKVKAIDFTSNDKLAKDPKHKSAIIDFMKDKWIAKKDIELIVDDSMRRDAKLQEILG
jgi:hypothetical protein